MQPQARTVGTRLSVELAKMMINVLVRQNGPLLWLQTAKEWVRVLGTARGPLCGEVVDRRDEPGAFAFKIVRSRFGRKELRRRRGVRTHGLVIAENDRLDEPADGICGEGPSFCMNDAHGH